MRLNRYKIIYNNPHTGEIDTLCSHIATEQLAKYIMKGIANKYWTDHRVHSHYFEVKPHNYDYNDINCP